MSDIFISYASEDRDRVVPIARALEGRGWQVWWDPKISTGQAFDRTIEEAMTDAKCVVVVWSRESVESTWVRAEASEGLTQKKLVPVLIDDVRPPLVFRQIQTASLLDWTGDSGDPAFRRFADDLGRMLGQVPEPGTSVDDAPPTEARRKLLLGSLAAVLVVALVAWVGYRALRGSAAGPEARTELESEAAVEASEPLRTQTTEGESLTPPRFVVAEVVSGALRWETAHSPEVTINGERVEPQGIMSIAPDTLYVLVARGTEGTSVREVISSGSDRPRVSVRSTPRLLTGEDVQELYRTKGLHDSRWAPENDLPNSFQALDLEGDKIVVDHATGLMWHASGSLSEMANWSDAQGYLERLNEQLYAGFSDWRLPTLEELATIIEPNKRNGDLHLDPVFDARQTWLWSSDNAGKRYGNRAWGISLESAHANIHSLDIARYGSVRPVRHY